MGDVLAADSNICAACLLVCTSALENFCFFKRYGSSANRTPCGGTRGCCGSCFQSGFDEDDFEKAERKAEEKRKKERGRSARSNQQHDKEAKDDTTKERDDGVSESVREAEEKEGKPPRVPDIVIHQPTPVHSMSNPS